MHRATCYSASRLTLGTLAHSLLQCCEVSSSESVVSAVRTAQQHIIVQLDGGYLVIGELVACTSYAFVAALACSVCDMDHARQRMLFAASSDHVCFEPL